MVEFDNVSLSLYINTEENSKYLNFLRNDFYEIEKNWLQVKVPKQKVVIVLELSVKTDRAKLLY